MSIIAADCRLFYPCFRRNRNEAEVSVCQWLPLQEFFQRFAQQLPPALHVVGARKIRTPIREALNPLVGERHPCFIAHRLQLPRNHRRPLAQFRMRPRMPQPLVRNHLADSAAVQELVCSARLVEAERAAHPRFKVGHIEVPLAHFLPIGYRLPYFFDRRVVGCCGNDGCTIFHTFKNYRRMLCKYNIFVITIN